MISTRAVTSAVQKLARRAQTPRTFRHGIVVDSCRQRLSAVGLPLAVGQPVRPKSTVSKVQFGILDDTGRAAADATIAEGGWTRVPSAVHVQRAGAEEYYLPRFWTGKAPLDVAEVTVDVSRWEQAELRSEDVPADLADELRDVYARHGVVLLRNTGLADDPEAMRRLAMEPMGDAMKYEGGANSREPVFDGVENVFDTGAPKEAHLHCAWRMAARSVASLLTHLLTFADHHEMAYVGESTRSVAFCCTASTPGVGASYLSDAVVHTDAILATELGQKLKAKGICYIRCLTDRDAYPEPDEGSGAFGGVYGVYNHWQRSFGVETPEEAEAAARAKGLEVEWGPGRYMRTKFVVSAFEYSPRHDRNLLYSSVADDAMWFDRWPGVMEMPSMSSFEDATPDKRPLLITFGDGTPFTREEYETYVDVYDQGGFPVNWRDGDVLVVCNLSYAHGRPAYSLAPGQQRELGVVLGPKYQRVGQIPGKW